MGDLDEVLTEYADPAQDMIRTLVLPILEGLCNREVARCISDDDKKVDDKTIAGIRRGARPHQATREKLWKLATEIAAGQAEAKTPTVQRGSAS